MTQCHPAGVGLHYLEEALAFVSALVHALLACYANERAQVAVLVCGPYLGKKPFLCPWSCFCTAQCVFGTEVPQVNDCYIVLWCINDTRLSWLVGTSGGLNN